MTKISCKKMDLHPEPYEYTEWIRTLEAVIGEQCREKEICFRIHAQDGLFPAVFVDKLRFNQIFLNILSNAIKFTPRGGRITMSIRHEPLPDGGCRLRISVQDTGIGMDPRFLAHATEPFSQEHTATTDNGAGTGLGLSIVRSLVELMGGTVAIHSRPGEGTCVTVELSLQRAAIPTAPESVRQTCGNIADLAGRRVLLAEDHPINAMIARQLLGKRGIGCDHAENGRIAVEMFTASPAGTYDAVLMDIRMPEMDGLDAARAIRSSAHPQAKTVPMIAMTANAFDDDVEKSRQAGMDAHLAKPVEPQQLYETLARFILGR